MKVLVAESDCQTRVDTALIFNICHADWELPTVDSAKQCLDMVKDGGCLDIVVLGNLDDMSGLDVIEEIRNCSEVPIMVLSDTNDDPSLEKALDLGADGSRDKPFNQLELIARVNAILR